MKKLYSFLTILAVLALFNQPLFFAQAAGIAFDASSVRGAGATAAPQSWTHTTGSGANRYLIVEVEDETADGVTSVTYNGVAMAQLKKVTLTTTAITMYLYGLAAPASGANTVTINAGTNSVTGAALSYTGVSQTGQPDASATTNSASTPSPLTTSVTTVAANTWGVLTYRSASAMTAGTNATFRSENVGGADGNANGQSTYDTNGPFVAAGSHSMGLTFSGNALAATVMVTLAPAATAAAFDFGSWFPF